MLCKMLLPHHPRRGSFHLVKNYICQSPYSVTPFSHLSFAIFSMDITLGVAGTSMTATFTKHTMTDEQYKQVSELRERYGFVPLTEELKARFLHLGNTLKLYLAEKGISSADFVALQTQKPGGLPYQIRRAIQISLGEYETHRERFLPSDDGTIERWEFEKFEDFIASSIQS